MFSVMSARLAGLRTRYAEPHRSYHGQAHVDALLDGLTQEAGAMRHPAAAELAVWYHDAIYDPAATDNEDRSAALLLGEMTGLVCPDVLQAAAVMIYATAGHTLPPGLDEELRADVATFLDLDMAVLGTAPAEYAAYEAGVAAEYAPVYGLEAFRTGRGAFLRGMLARERLFLTERFHRRLDAVARVNLRHAMASLGN